MAASCFLGPAACKQLYIIQTPPIAPVQALQHDCKIHMPFKSLDFARLSHPHTTDYG